MQDLDRIIARHIYNEVNYWYARDKHNYSILVLKLLMYTIFEKEKEI